MPPSLEDRGSLALWGELSISEPAALLGEEENSTENDMSAM
ncbi:hypothetical protein [Actinoplanes sp. URMC 104]